MACLLPHEAAQIFEAELPGYRWGKKGASSRYRGGDSPRAVAVDPERGLFFDHVLGKGGDAIDLIRLKYGINFREAAAYASELVGRDLFSDRQQRPKYTNAKLCKAELFKTGLLWRIERALVVTKAELFGSCHEEAARATRHLTHHQRRVSAWTVYDAAAALSQVPGRLSRACIAEAEDAYNGLACAITAPAAGKAA